MEVVTGRVATIVIDGPKSNLLNPHVMAQVSGDLRAADSDNSIVGIIVTGAGEHFCGGLDLDSIRAGGDPVEFASSLAGLLKLFPRLSKPVVALVNGDALASGSAVVAACDFAVTHSDALIGSYEVAVGVWPMVAQVPLVHRLGARRAMESIGSGEPFTAERACDIGLVNAVVPRDQLRAVAEHWLALAARGGAANVGRMTLYELADLTYDDGLDVALEKFAAQFTK